MKSCAGKTALVTAASRGIGRAIARRLASEGASVVVCARRMGSTRESPGTLRETVAMIEDDGGTAFAFEADLGDATARAGVLERASEPFGPPDILVNNVAYGPTGLPSQLSSKERSRMFDMNVNVAMELSQQALPHLIAQGAGWILNISSSTAKPPEIPYRASPEAAHVVATYGATKAALNRITVALAHEVSPHGIFVNAMAPRDIVLTSSADYVRDIARANPDMLEPVEMMAEAALELCTGRYVGRVVLSREIVHESARKVMSLDGARELGDALMPGDPEAPAQ